MQYARTLLDCTVFERLSLTDEDRQRGRLYADQPRGSLSQPRCLPLLGRSCQLGLKTTSTQ